jgi:pyruvate/2-oxoglutarate dehydrogenase complex dihydrolipoamide acyltransferase (E2) component
MRVEIKIEFLGEGADSAVFLQWNKQKNEKVVKGEVVCEVETYKSVVQVEAPIDGVLADLKFSPGEVVNLSDVLGYIETEEQVCNE